MTKIRSFRDLYAWQEGHQLVLQVYQATKRFPKDELFALVSQMRRCAVSITSNLAEGFSRSSIKEKGQFYSITRGSLTELQSQLEVAKDIGYLAHDDFAKIDALCDRVHKLTNGLMKSLSRQ